MNEFIFYICIYSGTPLGPQRHQSYDPYEGARGEISKRDIEAASEPIEPKYSTDLPI